MKRPVRRFGLLAIALGAACTPTPNILPTNDFNRPTDIAFMCLGARGTVEPDGDGGTKEVSPFVMSGRPMSVCHEPAVGDTRGAATAASIHNRTFAFVP